MGADASARNLPEEKLNVGDFSKGQQKFLDYH